MLRCACTRQKKGEADAPPLHNVIKSLSARARAHRPPPCPCVAPPPPVLFTHIHHHCPLTPGRTCLKLEGADPLGLFQARPVVITATLLSVAAPLPSLSAPAAPDSGAWGPPAATRSSSEEDLAAAGGPQAGAEGGGGGWGLGHGCDRGRGGCVRGRPCWGKRAGGSVFSRALGLRRAGPLETHAFAVWMAPPAALACQAASCSARRRCRATYVQLLSSQPPGH
jgi:hypothetical protein